MKRHCMACLWLFLALFVGAISPAAAADPSDEELAAHLREYVPKLLNAWKVPGLSLAVIRDGKVVLTEGYGYRDAEKKVPVTGETLFPIGSTTKAFTAASLGVLVDEGKLDWDKPVRTWMPPFELSDPVAGARMTPRDLLSHRSGLPRHDLMWYGSSATRTELVARLRDLEPSADFRDRFQYQSLMYMAAGHLVEQVSGKAWEDFVRERLFMPLGMSASNLSTAQMEAVEDRSLGYREKAEDEGGGIVQVPYRKVDAVGPAGSINSNAVDMAKWVLFQLGDGTWEGKTILARPTLEEMHRPVILVRGGVLASIVGDKDLPFLTYALGWYVQPYRGHLLLHHGGNVDGFTALVAVLPKERHGVVILTNLAGTIAPYALAHHLYDRLLGLPEKDWNGTIVARRDELRKSAKDAAAAVAAGRKKGTAPVHALDEYAGVYTHPSYGDLRIERQGSGLTVTFNAMRGPLEHWHYEVWNVTEWPGRGTKLTFQTNAKGEVDRVSLPLEPAVAEIVFTRKPQGAGRSGR